jgi:xanthine/uracil permease
MGIVDWFFTPWVSHYSVVIGVAIGVALSLRAASVARKNNNLALARILYLSAMMGALFAIQSYWQQYPPMSPWSLVIMANGLLVLWALGVDRWVDNEPDYQRPPNITRITHDDLGKPYLKHRKRA